MKGLRGNAQTQLQTQKLEVIETGVGHLLYMNDSILIIKTLVSTIFYN